MSTEQNKAINSTDIGSNERIDKLAQLSLIESTLTNSKKSKLTAYLLWFFFGFLGVHCFYLRNYLGGVIRLVGCCVGTFCFIALPDDPSIATQVLAFIGALAWLLLFLDLFRIPGMVQRELNGRRKSLIKKIYHP